MSLTLSIAKQKCFPVACILVIFFGISSNAYAVTACSSISLSPREGDQAVCFDINTTTPSVGVNVTVTGWVEQYQNGRWVYTYGDVKIYDGTATLLTTTSSDPGGTTPSGFTFETTGQHILHAYSGLVGNSDSIAVNVSLFNTTISLDPPSSVIAHAGDTISFVSHTDLYYPSSTGLLLLYGIEPGTSTPQVLLVTHVSAYSAHIIRADKWSLTFVPNGTFTTPGDYSFWIKFTGDELNAPAQSNIQHVLVGPFSTSTALNVSSDTIEQGQQETLTAFISATNPEHTIPTGTVSFYDSGNLLGTSAVDNNSTATITVRAPSQLGSHSITAVYSGDTDNQASTSAPVSLNVNFNPAILTPIIQLLLDN
ncbi:MAG: Ig-like domain-containing protein [Steroidobacter sp.]